MLAKNLKTPPGHQASSVIVDDPIASMLVQRLQCFFVAAEAKTRQARSNLIHGMYGRIGWYSCVLSSKRSMTCWHGCQRIFMGLPLGLGKPNNFVNALYQRIAQLPERQLTIYTALVPGPPPLGDGLQKRFLEPLYRTGFRRLSGAGIPRRPAS